MPTETQKSAGGTGQDALSSSSEIDSAASSPCLRNRRNAATAAPGEKVASLESADESVRAYDEDEIAHTVPCSCYGWSRQRVRLSTASSITPPAPPYSLAPAKARRRWREDFYDHVPLGARFKRCLHRAARREITRPVFPRSSSTGRRA